MAVNRTINKLDARSQMRSRTPNGNGIKYESRLAYGFHTVAQMTMSITTTVACGDIYCECALQIINSNNNLSAIIIKSNRLLHHVHPFLFHCTVCVCLCVDTRLRKIYSMCPPWTII